MKFKPEVIPDELIFLSSYSTESAPPHRTTRCVVLRQMIVGGVTIKVESEFLNRCEEYKGLLGVQIGNISELERDLTQLIFECYLAEGQSSEQATQTLTKMDLMAKRDDLSKFIGTKRIVGKKKPNTKILFEMIGVRNIYSHGRVCVILPTNDVGIEYETNNEGASQLTLAILRKEEIKAFEIAFYNVSNWLKGLKVEKESTKNA